MRGGGPVARRGSAVTYRSQVLRVVTITAVALGAAMIATAMSEGRGGVFHGDADIFRRGASDPFGDGSAIPTPESSGGAYRYGRILYPLAGWLFGGGSEGATEVALAVLAVAGCVVAVVLAALLLARRGTSPTRSLWLLAVPGVWFVGTAAFSESILLALLLGAVMLELRDRRAWASVCFAAMLLTREVAAVALVPAFVRDVRARGVAALPRWAATIAPLLGWWVWVRAHIGAWPLLEDSEGRRGALSLPFAGILRAVGEPGFDAMGWAAVVLGLATVACAVLVARRSRWPLLPATGVALALMIPFLGPNVWRWPGDAMRICTLPQVLVLLAALDLRRSAGRRAIIDVHA